MSTASVPMTEPGSLMDDDEVVLEQAVVDLSKKCGQMVWIANRLYSCNRFSSHPERCKADTEPGTWYSWWGINDSPLGPGDRVWKTTGWVKHQLLTLKNGRYVEIQPL
jgi:hypothetical protein